MFSPAQLPAPITMLGVPFDVVTAEQTVEVVASMVESGRPHYLATANVDFVVQALEDVELRRILFDAHLVVCDGMPLVWASRLLGNPLPERVTGSDMLPRLLAEAEQRGWRVFFLGGTEESVAKAAANTRAKHPRLQLVGAYSPPFKPLLEMNDEAILHRIREARPDLLFVAFGCPKQEKWLNMHFRDTGAPVGMGVGATIDFLAGTFRRAPRWMQRTGLEWLYRLAQEPGRLANRYGKGFWIFGRAILRQWWQMRKRRGAPRPVPMPSKASGMPEVVVLEAPARLDAAAAGGLSGWEATVARADTLVDFSGTEFIDSTGIGLLIRLRKRAREAGRALVLVAVPDNAARALAQMRLESMFDFAESVEEGRDRLRPLREAGGVVGHVEGAPPVLRWAGEVTGANSREVFDLTLERLSGLESGAGLRIDLSAVTFVDSSGVGAMVQLKKRLWERGVSVTFANPGPNVENVLRLTRLDEYLTGAQR